MRRVFGAVLVLAAVQAASACGADPYLVAHSDFEGGETFIVVDGPSTHPIPICSGTREGAEVTLVAVSFPDVEGMPQAPEILVNWADESEEMQPAQGAKGRVVSCEDGEESSDAELQVTFPPTDGVPVVMERVVVTYRIRGHEETATAQFLLTLCPPKKSAKVRCDYP